MKSARRARPRSPENPVVGATPPRPYSHGTIHGAPSSILQLLHSARRVKTPSPAAAPQPAETSGTATSTRITDLTPQERARNASQHRRALLDYRACMERISAPPSTKRGIRIIRCKKARAAIPTSPSQCQNTAL
ncbi:hypothetical protein B0H13DRAFT_2333286 [Mycena leptocephala]|nr:hypothetical protein B0H13DRAFT_2333286 [Mycena leptocephala]